MCRSNTYEQPTSIPLSTARTRLISEFESAGGDEQESLSETSRSLSRYKMHGCIERFRRDNIDIIVITRSGYDRVA